MRAIEDEEKSASAVKIASASRGTVGDDFEPGAQGSVAIRADQHRLRSDQSQAMPVDTAVVCAGGQPQFARCRIEAQEMCVMIFDAVLSEHANFDAGHLFFVPRWQTATASESRYAANRTAGLTRRRRPVKNFCITLV
ncbi:MAG TPA: hypothetical protein VJL90_05055 [Pseudorhodoplanes sp.]|nr:hypothetical protein [Pseudorhodoplanes sp.]